MLTAVGMFLLGLVLLALGGDSIVKGASGLAQRLGLTPFTTGLLLVAFATSLPELAVNGQAIVRGQQSLALGNAVGSNVVNVGLTLGAAAFAAPLLVHWRALSPLLLVLLLGTLAVMGLGLDGVLSRGDGLVLLVAFVAVVAFALVRGRNETPDLQAEIEAFARTRSDLALNIVRFVLAVVLLYYGSRLVVAHAPVLGAGLGMGPLLTGLLPVAIGTALPEMAAAITAARRGQGDLVAGHVIGSSLCNVLLVLGGMAVFNPLPLPASFVRFELPSALVFALMMVPMLRGDLRVSRREGGTLMVALLGWVAFELVMIQH
ncbi:sodium:calcium antiporter [Aerolutibacter ruishenii]|uniref:Cation:H+ antiporter n=1 Tax=Aerolutibacter ruishenii TaxID=686800 RepID=A0A562M2Z2_9GAMM|nr:sodium:calcium antiporter [Lysobacter ruishenii]TWI14315.1 cation:H+ antiporter [Lysobacter ruishenii]